MTSEQTRTPAQQVEKTVVCTKCGHPVWFMAEEREATTCTDCGTVNLRAQPDISETDDEEFATAALVAALADTVAEQEQTLDDWTHLVHARLETHSHRISQSNSMLVKAVTELCDLVDWLAVGTVHMIGVDACSQINERTAALRALESPAAAPDPSANRCPDCGGDGLAKYTDPNLVKWHHCQTCYGTGLVPADPPAAALDAAPTDPAIEEIIWDALVAAIRAYGRDGAR